MAKCDRCEREAPRLFDGLCGCCDITRAGGFRLARGYYETQVNPEVHEPAKERLIGIQSELAAGRMTEREAVRYKRTLVDPIKRHEDRLRGDRKYREAWRLEANFCNQAQEEGEREASIRVQKARKKVADISRAIQAEGFRPED